MCHYTTWNIFETFSLLCKIISHMITNLFNNFAVCNRYFSDMGGINYKLTSISYNRF